MKIAIVGPSPVPYTIGGAENLLWGLCDTINQFTEHQAELIKLPLREYDFWSLIESYYQFYNLELSHFDIVISTKYPSWMVQHKNCLCYMVHTLRGLYDTYHFMNLPQKVDRGIKEIDSLLDYMESNPRPKSLETFFSMLFDLRAKESQFPKKYFDFPAPFIRLLVHYMDNYGLSQVGVKRICAISETVKKRKDYFPKNSKVDVVYPPTKLSKFTFGDYKYVFMISRLDSPKRIDMLIKAMKYVKSEVQLLIAGTGPQEEELKRIANNDDRIKFLGFVKDDEVEDYYSNSLVIPYFPYDEDYGLITIEAMMHKKPVITTNDAGGPTEFVINKETGFVTKFDAKAIAEKIDYFAQKPQEAKRMGENGYSKVKNITWINTVNELLQHIDLKPSGFTKNLINTNRLNSNYELKRKKIVVTSTFPIYPPNGGGQARIFNIYKNLAEHYDVEIISFTNSDQKKFCGYIAPNLKEIRIPKSAEHQSMEWNIESKVGIPISDIAMITLSGYTKEYCEELKKSMDDSDLVILSHPYLYNEVVKNLGNKKIIYEAQDVESIIKRDMLPNTKYAKELVQKVFDIEKECCEKSELIITCSHDDQITINKIYNIPMEKLIEVPNGVDCASTLFTPISQRLENKKNLGLENEKLGLFMGSWHLPNIEACEQIFKIAEKCPNIKFLLMGSQCQYFEKRKLPSNVGLLGLVSEEEKNRIFSTVDFALNPMLSGSGTNLKMFDYMSAGIPIIATDFGTRGIEQKSNFIISTIEEMSQAVLDFNIENMEILTEESRKYVLDNFDWPVIVEKLLRNLGKLDL